jgi:hypothetical protein
METQSLKFWLLGTWDSCQLKQVLLNITTLCIISLVYSVCCNIVGIVDMIQPGWSMFWAQWGQQIFLFPKIPAPAVGPPSPPSLLFSRCSFLEVKWPGCHIDQSPVCSVEVNNELSYASPSPVCICSWTRKSLLLVLYILFTLVTHILNSGHFYLKFFLSFKCWSFIT